MEPTLRREIVCWDFSPPFTISQTTSLAQLQMLNTSAATTAITYMPNFENTSTFFELKELALFAKGSSPGTPFETMP